MKRRQIDGIWLGVSIFFFLSLAVSFSLMPLGDEAPTDSLSVFALVGGLMFWISLVLGIVTQCVLAHRRKKWYILHRIRGARVSQRIGLVSFFRNRYAAVADILLVGSMIGFIVAAVITKGSGYSCYVCVSLLVFAFSMHCILNGRVFHYVINQDKLLQTVEKERASSSK